MVPDMKYNIRMLIGKEKVYAGAIIPAAIQATAKLLKKTASDFCSPLVKPFITCNFKWEEGR